MPHRPRVGYLLAHGGGRPLPAGFPLRFQRMFVDQGFVLRVVERLDGEIFAGQRFRALGRGEEIDVPLGVGLCVKATQAIFRHAG